MSYSRSDNVDSWEEVICRAQRCCQKESWPHKHSGTPGAHRESRHAGMLQ